MKTCIICGRELEDWEDDICEDCMDDEATAILRSDEIPPDEEDF